jgi:hypothetical protein
MKWSAVSRESDIEGGEAMVMVEEREEVGWLIFSIRVTSGW